EIELAVALTSNMLEPKRFGRLALARSRRQLWVAPGHPLADMAQVSLQDVSPYPYILPMVDEGDVAAMRYWEEAGLQPQNLLRTSSMEAVREMVALGLGVTVLSDMVFRPWSLDGRRIRTVPLKNPVPPMEVGLIWLKGHRLGPVAAALRKYLEVAAGTHGHEGNDGSRSQRRRHGITHRARAHETGSRRMDLRGPQPLAEHGGHCSLDAQGEVVAAERMAQHQRRSADAGQRVGHVAAGDVQCGPMPRLVHSARPVAQ